ncbi:disulfide bond formation protein B [Pseudomonas sp. 5P_5.1_Bac1]|uniref:disulfide bond formation protein B n=1 Tax=Pseudomonas sp. 5P_5.1_Bac1 TaxID=2971616 RepID=UPI0021C7F1E1|nr:disulfide bond formation protein B [Pseudomonas sp. 5P_5.1_Bac1]MCU1725061.1 disulfide bond formation protein B [Pseudomonas sp. 5P_5.1_Bac1]
MPLACLRSIFLPAFLASFLVLCGAFYLEFGLGQIACPLCQGQRLLLAAFSLVCLCGLIHRPSRRVARRYLWLCLALAIAGVLLATRHVWLQGLFPTDDTPCLQSMDYLVEQGSLIEWLQGMLVGAAECVPITWSFMDLSVPELSLLAFLGLGVMVVSRLLPWREVNPPNPARS